MRLLPVALSLLSIILISSFAWGLACEKSVEKYLDSGESYSYLNVTAGSGQSYLLFSINGGYSMLAECGSEPKFLESYDEIEAVLGSYAKTYQKPADIVPGEEWQKRMGGLLDKFSASRAKEAECKRYVGIDMFPCNDRQSCIKSCYTPMCNELKQSNECDKDPKACGFIDSIVSFANNLTILDKGTAQLRSLVSGIAKIGGTEPLDAGIEACENMLESADLINGNALMQENGYYFCPRVAYDGASVQAIKDELVVLRNKFALMITPGTTAKNVASETQRRLELIDNLDRCASNIEYAKKALGEMSGSKHPAVNYSEVTAPVGMMNNIAGELQSLCASRKFPEAGGAMNRFLEEEGRAKSALANVSAEYDATKELYQTVLGEISTLPPDVNISKFTESMKMVDREIALVKNASDLGVLKGVILQNQKEAEELAKPKQNPLDQVWVPLGIAIAVTLLLYVLMRKTKRRGL